MKKIVYISGTRADFGLMKSTLEELNKNFSLSVIVTGMHLSRQFGYTVSDIEREFNIKKVESLLDEDSTATMVKSLAICLQGIGAVIEEINPDLIFVEGDRGEALAGALVGAHMNITVIHHGGGDVSGSVDNRLRNAITMLSDYHLAGNAHSQKKLIGMGIPEKNIFIVGEPGIDSIVSKKYTSLSDINEKYSLSPNIPMALLVFHPDTTTYHQAEEQIATILDAIDDFELQIVAVYANSDAGGRAINRKLDNYSKIHQNIQVFKNINHPDFQGLMNACSLMIGNSSAGLIELPSFKKPFICIGDRQKSRLKARNVIETGFRKEEIKKAIFKALHDDIFRKELLLITNPYGDGTSSLRINEVIQKISRDSHEGCI